MAYMRRFALRALSTHNLDLREESLVHSTGNGKCVCVVRGLGVKWIMGNGTHLTQQEVQEVQEVLRGRSRTRLYK